MADTKISELNPAVKGFQKGIPVLEFDDEIDNIARLYIKKLSFPERALADAFHIAYAVYYEMTYVLTWNCAHLANELFQRRLVKINQRISMKTPFIIYSRA